MDTQPSTPNTEATHVRTKTHVSRMRLTTDVTLALISVGLFVANLAVSLLIQGDSSIWVTDRAHGYQLHLVFTFIGLHLWIPIAYTVMLVIEPSPEHDYYGGYPWFLLAITAMVLIAKRADIPVWRRGVWAYLIGAQLAGFAAVHWSTIGN